MCEFMSGSSVPSISVSVLMPVLCSFYYCNSVAQFEIRDTLSSSFIVQDCFSCPGFLVFSHEIRIVFSRSVKNCWNFDGDFVESIDFLLV